MVCMFSMYRPIRVVCTSRRTWRDRQCCTRWAKMPSRASHPWNAKWATCNHRFARRYIFNVWGGFQKVHIGSLHSIMRCLRFWKWPHSCGRYPSHVWDILWPNLWSASSCEISVQCWCVRGWSDLFRSARNRGHHGHADVLQVAPGNVFVRRLSKTQVTLPLKSSPLVEKKRSIGEDDDDIPEGFGFK